MICGTTVTPTSETRMTAMFLLLIARTQIVEVYGGILWHDIKINFHVNLLIYSEFIGRTHGRMEIIRLRMTLQLCQPTNPADYRTVCKSDRKGTLENVKMATSTQRTTSLVSVELFFCASTNLLKRSDVRYYAIDFFCT